MLYKALWIFLQKQKLQAVNYRRNFVIEYTVWPYSKNPVFLTFYGLMFGCNSNASRRKDTARLRLSYAASESH